MDLTPELWQAILAASRQDWSQRKQWSTDLEKGRLTIGNDGHWQCSASLDEADRQALDLLLPVATSCGPFCMAQLGQSLDGRIATVTGDSYFINDKLTRRHLHRLRALVDAVVIGAGTAIADQPQLTVRHVDGPNPVRVVLDPNGRVPVAGPLFDSGRDPATTLHLVGPGLKLSPVPDHVRRVVIETGDAGFEPATIVRTLNDFGHQRILVEGGGVTVSRFIEAGLLDRLHLLIAPLLIGSGRPGINLPVIERLSQAPRRPMRAYPCGDELIVDLLQ